MAEQQSLQRREVYYRGRVQGVGFRYTTVHIAARFQVTGFVQNLPDGRVCLLAEGRAEEVARFLEAVEEQMGRHIFDKTENATPVTGGFGEFRIRF